ncbi:hypothetical protein C9I98_01945 [Photobacterium sanctipauli]|uniref:Uncharacterized protein n=1 Tax=Photobacterium sanctipauli TaxID=1342794 RepID=A0A2T3P0P7_9GAMM|nr:hypothetical protein [Photobacterium sanctipauli]PSW22049.1 hypothetical protein C9I98_01945 [Photobacterium sanctipauli]
MQLNLIVMIFALGIVAVDKLSWFDDSVTEYANVPQFEPSIVFMDEQHEKAVVPDTKVALHEKKLAEYYEQSMSPAIKKVVLGNLVVPAEY